MALISVPNDIKIISGWSNPGGSTEAFINLCNLFNNVGIKCKFYGKHKYHLNYCKGGLLDELDEQKPSSLGKVILHVLTLPPYVKEAEVIYSCHETNVFPMTSVNLTNVKRVHMVSKSQQEWHGPLSPPRPISIIPNVISNLVPSNKPKNRFISAIIGSIDPHKQTHISIERSLADGRKPFLFGAISDMKYYQARVFPYVERKEAEYIGILDKQMIYDNFKYVYHSSLRETFNYIKAECQKTEVTYLGLPSAESGAEYWSDNKILDAWVEIL